MSLRRRLVRNRVGKTNYATVLDNEISKLEARSLSNLPALDKSGEIYMSHGKDSVIGSQFPLSRLAPPKLTGLSKREKLQRLTSMSKAAHRNTPGDQELNKTVDELNKSKTNGYLSLISQPPRSSSENWRPENTTLKAYVPEGVEIGAKKKTKQKENPKGKLSEVTSALSHLFQKQGNTDSLRRYFVKWGTEEGTSQLKIPEFVKRLELMGFNITESEANELATFLPDSSRTVNKEISGASRAGIPLKELAIAASMMEESSFRDKIEHCKDKQEIKDTIENLENERMTKHQQKLFKHRFSKYKDQIYNLLKDEKNLEDAKVFEKLAFLGFSERALSLEEKETFLTRYVTKDKEFRAKVFYSDMNDINPNKKMQRMYLKDELRAQLSKNETEVKDYNPNKESFLVPSKLELYYPRLKKKINREGITIDRLGAMEDEETINLEKFVACAKELGIPEIHYFVRSKNGLVNKAEVKKFFDTERLAAAVDNLQRRERLFLQAENLENKDEIDMIKNMVGSKNLQVIQKEALEKFDHKNYLQHCKTFSQFRDYDNDKDGFISREEYFKTIADKTDLSQIERCALYSKLDPQATGRITFSQFAAYSGYQLENAPASIPSGEYNSRLCQTVATARTRQDRVRKLEREPPRHHLFHPPSSSRYSAWPAYKTKDTYVSTMYGRDQTSEKARLDNSIESRLSFQADDRQARSKRYEAAKQRRQKIDAVNIARAERDAAAEYFSPERTASLKRAKGDVKADYELRIKLNDIGV